MAEWIEKSLGEIAEVTKLAGFEFTKYIKYEDDGEIIALRALNLRNGELDLEEVKKFKNAYFVICGTGTEYSKLKEYQEKLLRA